MIKEAFKIVNGKGLINWGSVINQLKKEFGLDSTDGVMFTAKFEQLRKPKTYSQLRYFHCDGFLGRIVDGYREAGHDLPHSKAKAKEWVKLRIKTNTNIMFVEEFLHDDKRIITTPKSLSDATKEEMSHIIDWCTRTYSEYFGIELETVKQYKIRMGYKL